MFPGTRIVVLESNIKKNIGPRRGSIGFIREISEINIPSLELCLCFRLASILFTRYGFEEKTRVGEEKVVVLVSPIFYDPAQATASIQDMIGKFNSYNSATEKIVKEITAYFSTVSEQKLPEKLPFIIIAPLNNWPTDLSTCEVQELEAWLKTTISNNAFLNFVQTSIKSGHYSNAKSHSFLASKDNWEVKRCLSLYLMARSSAVAHLL